MKAHVLTGTKTEIAERIAMMGGVIREVIIVVDDPAEVQPIKPGEDIFAEMEPFTVQVGDVDYSREAIYARQERE
jgi:hypothetical protein